MFNRNKFAGKIYIDFLLSLVASLIATAISQIIVNPLLAQKLSSEDYGLVLTIIAVANTIIMTFGNSLNNTRLIVQSVYQTEKLEGDFNPLCFLFGIFSACIFFVYVLWLDKVSILAALLLSLFVFFGVMRTYGAVAFRININYVKNLILSVLIAVGNILGVTVFLCVGVNETWVWVYLLGEIIGVIYLIFSPIFREKWKFTKLFQKTFYKELILIFTTLSANLLVYLDRLLLYPVLGSEAVAVYTVASFFGKSLEIVMTPLSGVLLSYYSKKDYVMSKHKFRMTSIVSLALSIIFIGICALISKPITGIFYPSLINDAEPLLVLANIASVIAVAANMISPAVLKYASTIWQITIQLLYLGVYLGLGIIASRIYGLMGFAYAAIGAAIFKFILLHIVGVYSLKK